MKDLAREVASALESLVLETLDKAGIPYSQVPDDIEDLRCQLDEAMAHFLDEDQ